MGLIGSIVAGIAGGVFRAGREAYERSAEKSAAEAALPNAVTEARTQSAREMQRLGGADSLNGLKAKAGSFAQHYQSQIAKATDTDKDGKISRDELEKQVTAGGGTQAQATALYKAMDANGDGTVTVDELQSGIPVPPTQIAQQILQTIKAHRDAQAAGGSGQSNGQSSGAVRQAPSIDASLALSSLAASLPAKS